MLRSFVITRRSSMQFTRLPLATLLLLAMTQVSTAETPEDLTQQVRASETAFAASMANRDLNAFMSFLAEDAVFFDSTTILRGKTAVIEAWKPLYEGAQPPFSWKSETVVVLASGKLAHSSGPVFDSHGHQVSTFNSVWRREADNSWRVVFDKGCKSCSCAAEKHD